MSKYITDSMDVSLSELLEFVMDREAWRAAIHGVTKSRTWLSDWTELTDGTSIIVNEPILTHYYHQVSLFISVGSCLIVTKIWNDGLITAQTGFLGSCVVIARIQNNRLVTAQLQLKQTDLLLNIQRIVHSWNLGAVWPWMCGHVSSWLSLFLVSSSWFCPVQNANRYTQGQSGNGTCLGTCKTVILHI